MPGTFEPRAVSVGGVAYRYQVWLPPQRPVEPGPVILFLHGAGERGDDGGAQTHVGLGPALERDAARWPFIAVFPQCRINVGWRGPMLRQALAALAGPDEALASHLAAAEPAVVPSREASGTPLAVDAYFIELARTDMREHIRNLPDKDLAYFKEGTKHFDDYVFAVGWAQDFARTNRDIMMENTIRALRESGELPETLSELVTAGILPEIPDDPSDEVVLEVKHLNQGNVLKDVSFNLKKGEILGLAGLVGMGTLATRLRRVARRTLVPSS